MQQEGKGWQWVKAVAFSSMCDLRYVMSFIHCVTNGSNVSLDVGEVFRCLNTHEYPMDT